MIPKEKSVRAIDIKIVSLRNRFPIDLVIGSFFYFQKNLEFSQTLESIVFEFQQCGSSHKNRRI